MFLVGRMVSRGLQGRRGRVAPPWRRTTSGAIAICACCASLFAAAPAVAASMVFIKGNNVWIANADGSGQHQVTSDGSASFPYSSPSEDNHGVIAAGQGYNLIRMRQDGHVLSSFQPTADNYNGVPLNRPFAPVISPDGTKLTYFYDTFACIIGGECTGRALTEVSRSDQATDPSVFGHVYDRMYPSWVTNSRLMAFGGFQIAISLFDLGAADAQVWVDCDQPCSSGNVSSFYEGVLSPQHDKLATVRVPPTGNNPADRALTFYTVSGDPTTGPPPPQPTIQCGFPADPSVATPSFSPDGTQLLYSNSQGIWLTQVPATLNGNCSSLTSSLIIPGADQARFGLASVNLPPPRKAPCAGLHSTKLQNCQAEQDYKNAVARCDRTYHGNSKATKSKDAACKKKAKTDYSRALARIKCSTIKDKHKRELCINKANKLK